MGEGQEGVGEGVYVGFGGVSEALEEACALHFRNHLAGVGFGDGAGAHGDVVVEFDEDAADADQEDGAELGVLGYAGDDFDAAFYHLLDEDGGAF